LSAKPTQVKNKTHSSRNRSQSHNPM